jgi:CTP:phosphocholine cytidylyltransferase-like protein
MKKLTKKQAQIISYINSTIETKLAVLSDYNEENNSDMVKHCQDSLDEQLLGMSDYILTSNISVWDERLSNAIWEIREMPELQFEYWEDCLHRDVVLYNRLAQEAHNLSLETKYG